MRRFHFNCNIHWILCAGLALFCSSVALADYISPDAVQVTTPHYTPAKSQLKVGKYTYKVRWQGIPVGRATARVIDAGDSNPAHPHPAVVEAVAKSNKAIDIFYRLRHRSESLFNPQTFLPQSFFSFNTENSKQKFSRTAFEPSGMISTKTWKNGAEDWALDFRTGNETFDPISAAFLAKSLDVQVGQEYQFDVFNGKHRFIITFNVAGREKITINKKEYDAFKVIPSVKKLTDTKGEKRLHSAVIWLSADDSRDILKLESSVLIGSVTAVLEKFEPPPATLPDATEAPAESTSGSQNSDIVSSSSSASASSGAPSVAEATTRNVDDADDDDDDDSDDDDDETESQSAQFSSSAAMSSSSSSSGIPPAQPPQTSSSAQSSSSPTGSGEKF